MGEIRPKECEPRELTKDQLDRLRRPHSPVGGAPPPWRTASAAGLWLLLLLTPAGRAPQTVTRGCARTSRSIRSGGTPVSTDHSEVTGLGLLTPVALFSGP
eukprot:COSAG04_NODE_741_length_10670_cov_20.643837_8_plen_101_part_00